MIQVETLIDRCVMVTLKAVTAFGILPKIETSKIESGHQKSVIQAIDRVLDSAFRETPISVIDHCRNAAQVILSRWMAQETGKAEVLGKDLDQMCKALQNIEPPRSAARDAANIVCLLHSRGKANKQETESLRLSVEEDAEMSIQALAFILREIDWAVV